MTPWNRDPFCKALDSGLAGIFSGLKDLETLAKATALCAEEAEKVCSGRSADCAAGCPHCCVLNVAVLLPEAAVISAWIKERLDVNEIGRLTDRLVAHASWTRWMEDEERIARTAYCPFLDSSSNCSIHPVRPLACRGVVSLDRTQCREAFSPLIGADEKGVPSDLLRRGVFDEAFKLLAHALEQQGLESRSIEIGTGVLAFLSEPEYLVMFLSGRRLPRELWG